MVITCIGEEHLEGLGTLAGVAAEECSILPKVRGKGFAAVNVETPEIRKQLSTDGLRITTFGQHLPLRVRVCGSWGRSMASERDLGSYPGNGPPHRSRG